MKHWGMPGGTHHRQPTQAGRAAMLAAQAALYGAGEPLTPDEMLALREQLRIDADTRARQGELRLAERGRG